MGKPVAVIAQFEKNSREQLRVALDEYQGHRLLDVRILVPLAGHSDALAPTGKGIAIQVALLDELARAITHARSKAVELGWLP